MLRSSVYAVATGLCLVASQTSAIIVAPPAPCQATDGTEYFEAKTLTDGFIVTRGFRDGDGIASLAACESSVQLEAVVTGSYRERDDVYNDMIVAVASAETYTFDDLKSQLTFGTATANITPITPALCTCLAKEF